MQQWEYMWIYVDEAMGKQFYVANRVRLQAQTYPQALNEVGKEDRELVAIVPPTLTPSPTRAYAQILPEASNHEVDG
jgi:hypothetical protein